jgi:O-antigen/teichoic acid export membrane protein
MTTKPTPTTAESQDTHHRFINRALSFALWENLFKPVSPLLELVCAGLFVGGAWGRYKFYESLLYLLFRISLMGMDKGVIWYYSQVDERRYLKTIFRSLSWCLVSFAALALLTLASHEGWLPFSNVLLGKNAEAFAISGGGLLLYLMAVPLMLVSELCIQANVNKRNLKYRILVSGIALPVVTYGSAIAGHFFAPGANTLPICLLAGNVVGATVAVWGFLRAHRPSWSDFSLLPGPPWKMMRYSFPLASANIFSALAVRVDVFMLAGFAGVHSLEVYAVVSMIGKSLISIRQSFESILLSAFSSSGSKQLSLRLKHYFNYSTWLVMSIQGAFLAVAVYFGAEILNLISKQYAGGYWVLVATAFFVYLNTVMDFSSLLVLALGRTHIVPLAQVIFLAANLGLNFLLIPRWDALGAALALGLANTVGGLVYFISLALRNKTLPLLPEYWLSLLFADLILGLPAAWVLYAEPGPVMKAVCLVLSLGAVFAVLQAWYRRFNRILQRLPESA